MPEIDNPWIMTSIVPSDAGAMAEAVAGDWSLPAAAEPIADSGAPQPRGEPSHTNATQPEDSPNFSSGSRDLPECSAGSDDPVAIRSAPAEHQNHIPELLVEYGNTPDFPRGFCPHTYMDTLERIAAEIADVPLFVVRMRA